MSDDPAALVAVFDFNDDHCCYDPEYLAERLQPRQAERLGHLYPHWLDTWTYASVVRDAVAELNASTEENDAVLAGVLADGFHGEGCECSSFEYDTYTNWIDQELADIAHSHPDVIWALMRDDEVHRLAAELDFASLAEFARTADVFHKVTLTLDATGDGIIDLDGSVSKFVAFTDADSAAVAEYAHDGNFLEDSAGSDLDRVVTLTKSDLRLMGAILRVDPVIRTAEQAASRWDERFTDLTFEEAVDVLKIFDVLTDDAKVSATLLLPGWSSRDGSDVLDRADLTNLAAAVAAAHLPVPA